MSKRQDSLEAEEAAQKKSMTKHITRAWAASLRRSLHPACVDYNTRSH